MLPIPEEYESSLCEIKTAQNDLIATGYIEKIDDEFIQLRARREDLPLLPYRTIVKLNIYNHELGFRVLVGKSYISDRNMLRVVETISLRDYEQRGFFRVDVETQGNVLYPIPTEELKKGEDVTRLEQVRILNLSLGGMLFVCDLQLAMGGRYEAFLKLGMKDAHFTFRVCRVEEDRKGRMRYGCQFIESQESQSNVLCAYLFQVQREMIQKRREKASRW